MDSIDQATRRIRVDTPLGENALALLTLKGFEEKNRIKKNEEQRKDSQNY
jgi:hypothetical protein